MPIVPRINPAPLPSGQASGYAPESAFGNGGGAAAGLASGFSAVHDEAARIAREESDRADQIALTDARGQLTDSTTTTLFGPNGVLNRKGKDAFTGPEDARSAYFAAVGQIRSQLGNDRQRDAFNVAVNGQWNQINEQVQSHVAQQRQVYDTQSTGAAIENAQNLALQSYDKPAIVEPIIAGIRSDTQAFGTRNGWGDAQIKEAIDKRVNDTRVGVISRMLDAGNDLTASSYYDQHKDEIDGVSQGKIEKALDVGSTLGKATRVSDQIIAGRYAPGLLTAGNIDLTSRPRVVNGDGSVSTVRSMSFERDGKEILIPTVSDDGKVLSNDDAIAQYDRTGKQLGVFSTPAAATAYAQQLHGAQSSMLQGQKTPISATAALAQAESIENPKVREEAIRLVTAHFNETDHAERLDRENARARVLHDLESSNGRLNRASSDWQLIDGYTEGEHVLERQRQILHPPPDPGDPDKYNSFVAMAAISSETRQQLMATPITDIVNDKTLSGGQKTAIINMIRSERNKDVTDLRRDHTEAQAEVKRLQRDLKQATDAGDKDAIDNSTAYLYDAQQRETVLRGQVNTAARTAHFGSSSPTAAGGPPATAAPDDPRTRANPLGLTPVATKPTTPEMLRDLSTYGPGYADYLRKMGYAVPAVLPQPPRPKTP